MFILTIYSYLEVKKCNNHVSLIYIFSLHKYQCTNHIFHFAHDTLTDYTNQKAITSDQDFIRKP